MAKKNISLDTLCGGGFAEQVNRALQEIARNIQDPNTDAERVRKLNVTISFKPDSTRRLITAEISKKTALVPSAGIKTTMIAGKDLKSGQVEMTEYSDNGAIPGQMAVNQEGEVYEPDEGKILDLRRKA